MALPANCLVTCDVAWPAISDIPAFCYMLMEQVGKTSPMACLSIVFRDSRNIKVYFSKGGRNNLHKRGLDLEILCREDASPQLRYFKILFMNQEVAETFWNAVSGFATVGLMDNEATMAKKGREIETEYAIQLRSTQGKSGGDKNKNLG